VGYTGFKGDYQTQPALLPTANNFPWLARIVGTSLVKVANGAVFSLTGTDFPTLVFHVENSVSLLRAEVFEVGTNKTWHRFDNERDLGHNSSATAFYTLTWDGTTVHGNQEDVVPNGNYYIKMTVVRALGDESNPAHVETFTSPTFFLARPDISLETFEVSQSSVNVGDQVTLSATVHNTRIDPKPSIHVEFFDNDVLVGASDVDLAAGESRTVETAWTVGPDNHHLKVRVSPLPEEEYLVNNELELQANIGQTIVGVGGPNARVLALAPAKPNPSRGSVAFRFSLPKQGPVSLEVFDVSGRRLKSWRWSNLEAGDHSVAWDGRTEAGRAAPSGTVLLRLNAMGKTLTQKAVRLN
jgi:flagellar hook assembly protein FlgD